MTSTTMFHRDPREVPFIHGLVKKLLVLAETTSHNVPIREDDDFGFMTIHFLYKQMQHAESILALVPRRDAGLIARTMIDGLYQILWTCQAPDERARRWRSFAAVHDWRLIQGRLGEGLPVKQSDIRATNARLNAFSVPHRLKKPKANSPDPYYKRWYGGVTLADMADVVGRDLYDGPYAELSDWEHWGVSGIGESITKEGNRATVNSNSERVTGQALLAAFQ